MVQLHISPQRPTDTVHEWSVIWSGQLLLFQFPAYMYVFATTLIVENGSTIAIRQYLVSPVENSIWKR